MPNSQLILMIAVIVVVVAVIAWVVYQRNRTMRLRRHFGPEYDRHVRELGDRHKAEAHLAASEERVRRTRTRQLSELDRNRFREDWRLCQARFVDDPAGALLDADRLLTNIMGARGYRIDDPYSRTTDICTAYPHHAPAFRNASDTLNRHLREGASTEDLREAFLKMKLLFEEILGGNNEKYQRAS